MTAKNKIVLVFCYKSVLTSKYKKYLREVAGYVTQNQNFIRAVVVSGGFSQTKSFPGTTESTIALNFIKSKIPENIPIYQEIESLTTRENVCNSKALIKDMFNGSRLSLVIFCDAIRVLKAKILAEKFFKDYSFEMRTYDISLPGETVKQLWWTVAELAALYLPPIDYLRNKFAASKARRL